ncbi:hypothetical protein BCR33DRAFT_712520 [Rhizoclosmatium globosum]|uniref:MFS general substrate transporter n=1 Tax=Rhizoclosmatium globosum TaxID=329046 RepID=A0A1Y2CXA2_9FUNG|nr:hypothetical protein BCR33DRAFT_712520 [Rhizoclosmatium globosum]|eukprot:ORY51474.1 hypothetical protein BCR33DRAFT_712520 [Rhizoclosmatium globosum]
MDRLKAAGSKTSASLGSAGGKAASAMRSASMKAAASVKVAGSKASVSFKKTVSPENRAKVKQQIVTTYNTGTQIFSAAFIVLIILGASTSLNIIGGVGLTGTDAIFVTNVCVYSFSILFGLLAGPITNLIGPRLMICASWCCCIHFALIYGISYLGAYSYLVAMSWDSDEMPIIPKYAYLICTLLPLAGWALSWMILRPRQVFRGDAPITDGPKPTVRSEIVHFKNLFKDSGVWTLAACIGCMSWYGGSTISFSPVSLTGSIASSTRTMSLVNLIYQVTYIIGVAVISASFLDNTNHERPKRGRMTSAMLIVVFIAVLVVTYISAVTVYGAFGLYGLFDGFTHAYFVWLVGCYTNHPGKQARMWASSFKYALTQNVSQIVQYDKYICIGMALFALIGFGAFNYHFVDDSCEDEEDETVEFQMNVVGAMEQGKNVSSEDLVQKAA